jgi:hypothetical protein
MAAAAFKGTITMLGLSGAQYQEPFAASDVANAFVTFDSSGLAFLNLPEPVSVVDVALSASGTDTTKLRFWVNNRDSGKTVLNSGVVSTVNNRVPLPLNFGNPAMPGNVQIQLKQLA